MSIVSNSLYPGSFRDAPFWFQDGETSGGRKTVIHEYPQKDFRFVEDLGKNLKTFEIRAIIKGILYFSDRKRLEDAMESPGIGILVHPFRGNISVYPIGYTASEDQNRTGVATYTLNFAEAQKNISPRVTGNNTALIANLYRELYAAVGTAINAEWTLNFIRNIYDGVQAMQRTIDALKALSRIAVSSVEGRTQFTKSSNSFNANKYISAKDSARLADNVTGMTGDFDGITSDQPSRFDINNRAFGIGADDTFLEEKTLEIVERNKNRKLLNGVHNLLILTDLYTTASQLTYEDEIQLDNTQDILDANFYDLTNNDSYFLTNDLIHQISELRNQVRIFFDNLRLTVAKVTTIIAQPIPATVLAYQYYGNTDNYQEILDLNDVANNPAIISGELKILEQTASG